MGILDTLKSILSIKLGYEKKSKTSLVIIDPKIFEENEVKEMSVWCWKCMKKVKVAVRCKSDKFFIKYIGCPHMKSSR